MHYHYSSRGQHSQPLGPYGPSGPVGPEEPGAPSPSGGADDEGRGLKGKQPTTEKLSYVLLVTTGGFQLTA
jgi:hypothetical protein